MAKRIFNYSFSWIIVACGVAALLAIIGNLIVLGTHRFPADTRFHTSEANPGRGRVALEIHGCGSCHVIPGVRDAVGRVGPRLEGIGEQIYIAGVLTNTPENMIRWIRDPQEISPQTAMPDLGISEEDARDMAAYLYQASR